MTDELRYDEHPQLERPVMIAAFRGWNDGGQGASLAAAYLARAWAAQPFASIDPENFFDFQATRPMVSLVDGITRQIDWPETTFLHAPLPGGPRAPTARRPAGPAETAGVPARSCGCPTPSGTRW